MLLVKPNEFLILNFEFLIGSKFYAVANSYNSLEISDVGRSLEFKIKNSKFKIFMRPKAS